MNNYKNFFNTKIFSLFAKNSEDEIIKKKFDTVVSNLIRDKDQEKLIDYINKGYVFPKEKIFLNTSYILEDSDTFNSPVLKKHISKNYTEFYREVFASDVNIFMNKYINSDKSNKYKFVEPFAASIYNFTRFVNYVGIKNAFNDDNFSLNFLNQSQIILRLIQKYEPEEKYFTILKSYNSYLNEKHKSYVDDLHYQEMNQFTQILQSFDNIKKIIHKNTEDSISKFSEEDLPAASKKIISEIRYCLKEIDSKNVSMQQDLSLKNLYDKRLPQILNEYITISPKYKEKLMSHNENVDDILLDSLIEIKNKITEISDEIQNEKVNKFKATHKYLKTV